MVRNNMVEKYIARHTPNAKEIIGKIGRKKNLIKKNMERLMGLHNLGALRVQLSNGDVNIITEIIGDIEPHTKLDLRINLQKRNKNYVQYHLN